MKPIYFTKAVPPPHQFVFFKVPDGETLDFELEIGQIKSQKFPIINDDTILDIRETVLVTVIYFNDFNSLEINNWKGGDNLEESLSKLLPSILEPVIGGDIEPLIKKGWIADRPEYLSKLFKEEDKAIGELRKHQGYVIPTKEYRKNIPALQGGLSISLFNDIKIQNYILKDDYCGYIGHPNRTFEWDRKLEKKLSGKGWSQRMMAVFLCSNRGRTLVENLDDEEFWKLFEEWDFNKDEKFQAKVKEEMAVNN